MKTQTDTSEAACAVKGLDAICREKTAFASFEELLNAEGNYRPSIDASDDELWFLANQYDNAQAARGDSRRCFLYNSANRKVTAWPASGYIIAALKELHDAAAAMDTSYKTSDFLPGDKSRRYYTAIERAKQVLDATTLPLPPIV